MALMQCDFFSDVLGLSMSANVILPQHTKKQIGMEGKSRDGKWPCLYLLHGMSDDHTIWLRRTSIERYVADKGIAVIMPAVHKSRYCDLKTGDRYWEYISEEVPRLMRDFFPISDKREDNFVAGLSMGGYGAFKLALNKPGQYSAGASLSGSLYTDWNRDPKRIQSMKLAFGSEEEFATSINNLVYVAQKLGRSPEPKPRFYQCCGTEDSLYESNQKYKAVLEEQDFDYTYEEEPGSHEWGYWDMKIQRVLEWLQL
ncbi:MAG: esterase family protein [Candidatus Latescibacteria bacterium]|nr:esterase family protein [Candidatus Latescibacterota bacterium]